MQKHYLQLEGFLPFVEKMYQTNEHGVPDAGQNH